MLWSSMMIQMKLAGLPPIMRNAKVFQRSWNVVAEIYSSVVIVVVANHVSRRQIMSAIRQCIQNVTPVLIVSVPVKD